VEPPQTNVNLAGHAKSDGPMHSSLHEITEVQQTTARLLGLLVLEALYACCMDLRDG
jgi:hypothetical protein